MFATKFAGSLRLKTIIILACVLRHVKIVARHRFNAGCGVVLIIWSCIAGVFALEAPGVIPEADKVFKLLFFKYIYIGFRRCVRKLVSIKIFCLVKPYFLSRQLHSHHDINILSRQPSVIPNL